MNTMFLNPGEIEQVKSIMSSHGISGFDACVRLWGRGKTIHVSGDVHKGELACLLDIARYLNGLSDQEPAALGRTPGAPTLSFAAAA